VTKSKVQAGAVTDAIEEVGKKGVSEGVGEFILILSFCNFRLESQVD
jgi:hypothetical protein